MKTIVWVLNKGIVTFKVNWFEYLVLKRIFQQQRHKFQASNNKLKGFEAHTVIIDEAGYIPLESKDVQQ